MRRLFALFLGVSCLWLCTGCMTMAKRTLKEAKGASSEAEAVPGTGGGNFSRFTAVNIAPPRSDLGALVSSEFKTRLSEALRQELVQGDDAPFKGGSATLTIEPEINWYQKGGGVFPEKFAVVMFWLKADGAAVGQVQVSTKSEATRTGDGGLAESMAKELRTYFEDHGKKN